ncbi:MULTISPECIES: hypothetical protein [unclassified Paenibacillus]|uniref:hypothetical protein n=1 Tax=unclassified Paenibacillus TaxID=185978 RepID=UPI002F401EEC
MRWPKGWNSLVVIIMLLIIIGVVVELIFNPLNFLLPLLIIGGIFLLYKYPPAAWRKGAKSGNRTYVINPKTSAKPQQSRPRSKTVPFHVIDGGKEDDDKPKYH